MTDEATPTLAETINSAIAEVTPSANTENNNGDSTTTDESTVDSGTDAVATGGDGAAGDSVDAGTAEGGDLADDTRTDGADAEDDKAGDTDEVDENDPEAVKAAEAAGRTRDPKTGKFTKTAKKPETDEAKAAAAKTAADAKKKPADALNDPIPKDVKKQTAERIQTLIKVAKDSEAKVTEVTGERNLLLDRIMSSGTSPEQYQGTLEILRQMNSNDPVEQRKALDALQATATELAQRLGVVLPGVDVLAKHADLKQQVELGQISRHVAEELAAARNREAHATTAREQTQAQQREQTALNTAKTAARGELDALETTLRTADPNYEAKKAILTKTLQASFAELHPSKWAKAFQAAYNALPASAVAPRPAPRAVAPTNQPLRARQVSGGKAPEPKSMLEAINASLSSIGR